MLTKKDSIGKALVKIFQVLAPVQLKRITSIGFFSLALRKIPTVIVAELHNIGAKTTFSPEPIGKKGFSRETFMTLIVYMLALAVLTYLAYKFLYGSGATSLSVE